MILPASPLIKLLLALAYEYTCPEGYVLECDYVAIHGWVIVSVVHLYILVDEWDNEMGNEWDNEMGNERRIWRRMTRCIMGTGG